jgi:hypothetical protein
VKELCEERLKRSKMIKRGMGGRLKTIPPSFFHESYGCEGALQEEDIRRRMIKKTVGREQQITEDHLPSPLLPFNYSSRLSSVWEKL